MPRNDLNIPLLILIVYIIFVAFIVGVIANKYIPRFPLGDYKIYLNFEKAEFIIREGLPLLKGKKELKTNKESALFLELALQVSPYKLTLSDEFSEKELQVVYEENRNLTEKKDEKPDQVVRKDEILADKEAKLKAEGSHKGEKKSEIDLSTLRPEVNLEDERDISREDIDLERERAFSDKTLVGIYHAHTAENYKEDNNYRAKIGEKGEVVKVGRHLAEVLADKYQIKVEHSKAVHDHIHSKSYIEALATGEEIVRGYEELKLLFDIHRDAIPNAPKGFTTTEIEGEKVAQIMIVVTNDHYGLPHPNWENNLKTAHRLGNKMEELYPGLLREIKLIENRRYNQHLHSGTLLLEVGSTENTVNEAKRAIELFADVVAEFIKNSSD